MRAPMVLGHESAGKVIKLGPNVKHLKEGNVGIVSVFRDRRSLFR